MSLRSLSLVLTLALAAGAAGGASAATAVFTDPGTLAGNQPWTYDLGQDFSVNKNVTLFSLGAFTNGGANSNVEVALFRLNDANPADGGTLITSTTVPGNTDIAGDYAFKNITPVTLLPGFYQLQSFGGGVDTNFNTGFTVNPDTNIINFNTLGGALTQGTDFYSAGGNVIATTADSHWYAAASMLAAAVPESSVWLLLMAGVGLLGGMLRFNRQSDAAAAA
jgi:hypothetical protein